MRKMILLSALAAVALISGCASVSTAKRLNNLKLTLTRADDVAHFHGNTWGLYFFGLPVFTGSTKEPGSVAFANDTVTVDSVVDMITSSAARNGATRMVDLQSRYDSRMMLLLPFFSLRECQASGNAVR